MNFLDTITAKDLAMFDRPVWQKGETYDFVVQNINEVVKEKPDGTKNTVLSIKTRTMTGPNEGRTNYINVSSAAKSNYVSLLLAVFGKDAVVNKTAKLSDAIGKVISATVGDVFVSGTKEFQNWYGYKSKGITNKSLVDTATADDDQNSTHEIPF
jgi:hypothetical protein